MSGDRYFADTSIILYSFDSRDRVKQEAASAWLSYLWSTGNGRLSWQVINEFYANAVRKMGLPALDARRVARSLARWKPTDESQDLIERAWYWMDAAQVSYRDGLILASAEQQGCRLLLSEDFQAGRVYGTVEIVNPFQTPPPAPGIVVAH